MQKQSVQQMLNQAQARIKEQEEILNSKGNLLKPKTDPTIKEKAEKEVPLTFHEKQLAMKIADPQNSAYEGAKALGKLKAQNIIAGATNLSHPDHKEAFKLFNDKYALNRTDLEEECINEACDKLNAHPYEMYDPAYESNILKKYSKPSGEPTKEKVSIVDSFHNKLKEKWATRGYKGDKVFIDAYRAAYNIMPSNESIDMQNIHPKR